MFCSYWPLRQQSRVFGSEKRKFANALVFQWIKVKTQSLQVWDFTPLHGRKLCSGNTQLYRVEPLLHVPDTFPQGPDDDVFVVNAHIQYVVFFSV